MTTVDKFMIQWPCNDSILFAAYISNQFLLRTGFNPYWLKQMCAEQIYCIDLECVQLFPFRTALVRANGRQVCIHNILFLGAGVVWRYGACF